MTKTRFEALDAFRGLCALSVVIFHTHLVGSITELDFFRGSDIFVEFFFVLSGFVLAHGYGYKENLKFIPFLRSRFFRLYPLHFFMFFVFLMLEFAKLFAHKFGGLSFNNEPFTNGSAIKEIIPNLLLLQSWTPFTNHLSFNYPSWSISIEFYMYMLLYFTISFFGRRKLLFWIAISLSAFSLIFFKSDILVSPVLRGLSCFFGGSFTYVIYRMIHDKFRPSFTMGSILEIMLIILVIYVVGSNYEYRNILASLLFFGTVLFFSFESGILSKALKTKPFQQGGKLSYSIYMTHAAILFCLISLAMIVQKATGSNISPMIESTRYLDFGNPLINNLILLLILSAVVLVSSLTYKYVELPGQKLNSKYFPQRHQ